MSVLTMQHPSSRLLGSSGPPLRCLLLALRGGPAYRTARAGTGAVVRLLPKDLKNLRFRDVGIRVHAVGGSNPFKPLLLKTPRSSVEKNNYGLIRLATRTWHDDVHSVSQYCLSSYLEIAHDTEQAYLAIAIKRKQEVQRRWVLGSKSAALIFHWGQVGTLELSKDSMWFRLQTAAHVSGVAAQVRSIGCHGRLSSSSSAPATNLALPYLPSAFRRKTACFSLATLWLPADIGRRSGDPGGGPRRSPDFHVPRHFPFGTGRRRQIVRHAVKF